MELAAHSVSVNVSLTLIQLCTCPFNDILLQLLDGSKALLKEKNDLSLIMSKEATQKGMEHLAPWMYL